MSKRKTGLGTAAFFQSSKPAPSPTLSSKDDNAVNNNSAAKPKKPKKVRTTVTLYPDTLATLEAMKIHGRRQGEKVTYSDILAEAIHDLAEKWQVEI